jgi:N-hydroxyarylamine O-acetyltransferase
LLVSIDGQKWVGDVGFGDGLVEPAALGEGVIENHPLKGAFRSLGDGWWRYSNEPRTGGPTFDFSPAVRDPALLEKNCEFLQTAAESPFVQNAVAQKWRGKDHYSLRGRVLRRLAPNSDERVLIDGPDAYVEMLRSIFDLDFPEAARLWPKIEARHAEIFAEKDPLAAG